METEPRGTPILAVVDDEVRLIQSMLTGSKPDSLVARWCLVDQLEGDYESRRRVPCNPKCWQSLPPLPKKQKMYAKYLVVALAFFWPLSAIWYAAGLPPWWWPVEHGDLRANVLYSLHALGFGASAWLISSWKRFWR